MTWFPCVVYAFLSMAFTCDATGDCPIVELNWNNRNQGWNVSNPDKTMEQTEDMLLGKPPATVGGADPALFTDVTTTIRFDVPTLIKRIDFKIKATQAITVSANHVMETITLTAPESSDWYSVDLFRFGMIEELEITPQLGPNYGEYKLNELFISTCGESCLLDWRTKDTDFTISNSKVATDEEVEAALLGAVLVPGAQFTNLVTDITTTIQLNSPTDVESITFISKFADNINISAFSSSSGNYLNPPLITPDDETFSQQFTVSLISLPDITSIDITPNPANEYKLNDVYLDICPDTCSNLTLNDVTVTPRRFLGTNKRTPIEAGSPIIVTINNVAKVKSIGLYAQRFDTSLVVRGGNALQGQIFKVEFEATQNPFRYFQVDFPDLQQEIKYLEFSESGLVDAARTRIGRVRSIQVQTCTF